MSDKVDAEQLRELVIDTSAFFSKTSELKSLVKAGRTKLCTIDLIVFEFFKLMQAEIRKEEVKKIKSKRLEMLKTIRDRFPDLLSTLEIEIKSPAFTFNDLKNLYDLIQSGQDAGDCMIWLKMRDAKLDSITTQNFSHWKKLGANVVPI